MFRSRCPLAHARRLPRVSACLLAVATLLYSLGATALQFDTEWLGGISANLNTEFSLGGQWRIQDRDPQQIGKANLNPTVCRSACQPHLSTPPGTIPGRIQLGLEGEGDFVNSLAVNAPGAGSINTDDGNLNYDKYEITQGVAQLKQDLALEFGDVYFLRNVQLFGRYAAFHDFVNYRRPQFYPNFYTPQDRLDDDDRLSDGEPSFSQTGANRPARDFTAALASPGGQFGEPQPGTALFRGRGNSSSAYNEFAGQDIDLLDAFFQADIPVPFTDLYGQLTVGEQIINWGESTILVVNSLNTINPPNVNALFRPAFLSLAAVFEPIGAIKWSMPLTANTSLEAFYQYDWEKVEIPPSGAFLSTIDVTLDQPVNFVNPGFGQVGDDPDGNLRAQQQLLTGIADTQGNVPVFEENASNNGQFGFAYTWFLPDFNNGTELRFYYAKYNSRLPYLSAFATQESCLQAAPDGLFGDNANGSEPGLLSLMNDCPGQDTAQVAGALAQHLFGERAAEAAFLAVRMEEDANNDGFFDAAETGGQGFNCPPETYNPGSGPCAEGYVLDQFQGLLEYPEGINLYGISFNTSFGDISFQGEVVYRPNLPLQIDDIDVAFTALQPGAPLGCSGANANANCVPGTTDDIYAVAATLTPTALTIGDVSLPIGALTSGGAQATGALQGLLDQVNANLPAGASAITDLADLPTQGVQVYLSDAPGRANAFPSFLDRYRGIAPGTRQGSLPDLPNTPQNEGRQGDYIQGYERFQAIQYNVGATYVIGPGNWLRSNQIILLFEVGANQILGFPEFDELQIDGPGTFYHASVGSDGTGAPACEPGVIQGEAANPNSTRTRRANSTICGAFQPRFNSTQQKEGFATSFSWGYRIIGIVRYENVLPGISFEPVFVIGHDVSGTSPGPGENFLEGRQVYVLNVEMRYQANWSMTAGFTVFRGAEPYNLLNDRDFVQLGIRYRF